MHYLTALNDKQREAVQATEGYLRVIAGAGSGKTKLLVSRYAYLVQAYGIDPANILCVTFTNKAAGEMKRRIRALIGAEYDTSLICTYHGFCVRVLREDVEKIFYPKEFQIIDTTQQKAILAEIYQQYELKLDHGSFEKILRQIARAKALNRHTYVAGMCAVQPCQILPNIDTQDDRIIEDYMQREKQVFALDFQDLLYFTLDMFERCPEVLGKWQDRLNYIQVDEFQDSSENEMKLIDLLSAKHKNLMIVGDPDQNIYEWRGSDVRLLVNFDEEHHPTKTVYLNQNYRSTPQVLQCANTLIENNRYRLKKDLFTKSPAGEAVMHYHTKNEYAEADAIAETILGLRKTESSRYADTAVLYRSGFLSRVIEKKFTESGIPYEIVGGVKFYHRMEIQDILAYLRVLAFRDDVSFKRIVNKPRRRFGRVKMQHLQGLQQQATLYDTLVQHMEDPLFRNSGAAGFVTMMETLRETAATMSVSQIVEQICVESGYEAYIRELGDMERFENLAEFKRIAAEFETNFGETVTLSEFIGHISLQSEEDGEERADNVKLMTIHAAKGLEFPNVFVLGLSEGIFPSSKTIEERKELGLEEERRLCYVAITRAQKRLFLLDSEGFTQNGKQKLPSRFLKEIGEQNYIRIGTISKELQEEADRVAAGQSDEPCVRTERQIGDEVEHPAFGKGTIVGFEKNKNSYRIRFEGLASERVMAASFFDKPRTLPVVTEQEPTEEQATVSYEKVSAVTTEEKQVQEPVTEVTPPPSPVPPDLTEYENLWKREDVPKSGWICTEVTDLGAPVGVCQMCGHQIIRYVHHMIHPLYRPLKGGCICAGKMEGDVEKAKQREQDFKSKQSRRETFKTRKWKTSKNNNCYLKIKEHLIVLFYDEKRNIWKYSLDNVFCKESFATKEDAMDAAFEALERL